MSKLIFTITLAFASLFLVTAEANAATKVWATWYGPYYHGRKTASGEIFNQWAMTAAHRTLPFGTKIRVSHGDKSVIVTINDRGPFVKGRTLDLSRAAARELDCDGICSVTMEIL